MRSRLLLYMLIGAVGGVLALALPPSAHGQPASADTTWHEVAPGETLFSIAQAYDTSVAALQEWNDLDDVAIEVEQSLIVALPPEDMPEDAPDDLPSDEEPVDEDPAAEDPGAEEPADTVPRMEGPPEALDETPDGAAPDTLFERTEAVERPTEPPAGRPMSAVPANQTLIDDSIDPMEYGTYTIREGDTFYTIAARVGTSADELFALNAEWTEPLPPGRVLRLPTDFSIPTHDVAEDESIYDVAAQYGVSVRALREANGLAPDVRIEPEQRLRIPGRGAPRPSEELRWPDAELEGFVAVYPDSFEGRLTASGTPYAPDDFVVSHPDWPFGTLVLITNPETERQTFARVIDRGPLDDDHVMDVSEAVALHLELSADHDGGTPVTVRRID